jgi:hypothetical protein
MVVFICDTVITGFVKANSNLAWRVSKLKILNKSLTFKKELHDMEIYGVNKSNNERSCTLWQCEILTFKNSIYYAIIHLFLYAT